MIHICASNFTIVHGGRNDVTTHVQGKIMTLDGKERFHDLIARIGVHLSSSNVKILPFTAWNACNQTLQK